MERATQHVNKLLVNQPLITLLNYCLTETFIETDLDF